MEISSIYRGIQEELSVIKRKRCASSRKFGGSIKQEPIWYDIDKWIIQKEFHIKTVLRYCHVRLACGSADDFYRTQRLYYASTYKVN